MKKRNITIEDDTTIYEVDVDCLEKKTDTDKGKKQVGKEQHVNSNQKRLYNNKKR